MDSTIALRQLQRLLGLPGVDAAAIAAAIERDPEALAAGLFEEAVASDDVTGLESALDYLDGRLGELAPYLPATAAARVRGAFATHASRWGRIGPPSSGS